MAILPPIPDSFPTCGDPSLDSRIVCDGLAFPAHREVLSYHSPLLKILLDSMPEPKRLNMLPVAYDFVEPMMEFFYTYDYTASESGALRFHMQMLLMAEILQCTFLRRRATRMLEMEALKPTDEISMNDLVWMIERIEKRCASEPDTYGDPQTISKDAARQHFTSLFDDNNFAELTSNIPSWTASFLKHLAHELKGDAAQTPLK